MGVSLDGWGECAEWGEQLSVPGEVLKACVQDLLSYLTILKCSSLLGMSKRHSARINHGWNNVCESLHDNLTLNWGKVLDGASPLPISTPILESRRRSARPQLRMTSLRTGRKGRTSHSRRVSSSSSSCTAAWLTHSNMWLSISPRAGNRGNVWACFHKSWKGEKELGF